MSRMSSLLNKDLMLSFLARVVSDIEDEETGLGEAAETAVAAIG